MKKISVLLFIILMIVSCKESYIKNNARLSGAYNDLKESPVQYEIEKPASAKKIEQKIIKTSFLSFETESVEKTFQHIKKQITIYKGFIQSDNTYKEYGQLRRSLIVRIPTQNFQPVIDSISNTVKTFDTKKTLLKDVTEEFVDLEARLKAKKALENRYLQLLAKAKNVKEMLEIEREIATIREEIESKQGRLKYLQDKVSFSTITIDFYETITVVKSKSKTYFSQVTKALKGGFTILGDFIIGLLYIWPFIIIIGLLFIYIRKKRTKK